MAPRAVMPPHGTTAATGYPDLATHHTANNRSNTSMGLATRWRLDDIPTTPLDQLSADSQNTLASELRQSTYGSARSQSHDRSRFALCSHELRASPPKQTRRPCHNCMKSRLAPSSVR